MPNFERNPAFLLINPLDSCKFVFKKIFGRYKILFVSLQIILE